MSFKLLPILFFSFFVFQISAQDIVINEFQASNSQTIADEDEDYEDWIEVLNTGQEAVNLEGFGLSDDDDLPYKWVFPSVLLQPNQYLLVWASGKDKVGEDGELHTNFSISSSGEPLSITHPNGNLIDYIEELNLPTDVSYGRGLEEEFGVFFYYYTPTPGFANTTQGLNNLIEVPTFSHSSGFYEQGFDLSIGGEIGASLIYTLDGSEPKMENIGGKTYQYLNQYPQQPSHPIGDFIEETYETHIYQGSIAIEDRSNHPNKLANITTTKSFTNNNQPATTVPKATVVKSRMVVNGINGPVTTHTYFVSEESKFDTHLPIVSLSLDESDLFDFEEGIYVAGSDFVQWREENPNQSYSRFNPANYYRRGIETEKNATFQWFESGELTYQRNIGVRLHGASSRTRPMKSFRLYARNQYDTSNSFDYPLFGEGYDDSYRRLILRNSGNDAFFTLLRDAFLQNIVGHLNFDTQAYRPLVHYVNGEYWGLINLRERYDRHYFERVYGIEEGELDFLDQSGLTEETIKEGDNLHWINLYSFIADNNMQQDANFAYVETQMDVKNFIDYQLANIYISNTDWPGNNIAYFRKKTDTFEEDAAYGKDGRWRWVVYDLDFGFGLFVDHPYTHNTLAFATQTDGPEWPNPDWSTLVFRRLLQNNNFRNLFVNRYADMMNTTFLPERIIPILHELKHEIEDEIPNMQERWNANQNWENDVQVIENFANNRLTHARNHVQTHFELAGQHEIQLALSQEDAGTIKVNSIELRAETPGVDEEVYPWTGIYFEGVPVRLEAIANEGYEFSHWSGDFESMQEKVTVNLSSDSSIVAHFNQISNPEEVLYFWLMDNEMPNNTPLETLESTYTHPDLSENASIAFESALVGYPFNSSHPNWRVASMERRNRPTGLNYRPLANDNTPFEEVNMRGLQVREMFQTPDGENIVNIHANTEGFSHIKLAFAVLDEDAVDSIVIEYKDENQQWSQEGLVEAQFPVFDEYQKIEVDFSNVETADENPDFSLRIRFEGEDLSQNNGSRITFNNISITGSETLSNEPNPEEEEIIIYPNPVRNILFVEGLSQETKYEIFNLQGRIIQEGKVDAGRINTENLSKGFYLLALKEDTRVSKFKFIKR